MKVEVVDNRAAHRFEAHADGALAGYIAYRIHPGRISMIHTEVDDAFEGKGIGSTLVKRALQMVRESGLGLLPRCPFVRAYLQRHLEYLDLVPADERSRCDLPEESESA